MQINIPVDWFIWVGGGTILLFLGFLLGYLIGVRRERKHWLRFIEQQCRMSLSRQPIDPVQGMLSERDGARERRLSRRD